MTTPELARGQQIAGLVRAKTDTCVACGKSRLEVRAPRDANAEPMLEISLSHRDPQTRYVVANAIAHLCWWCVEFHARCLKITSVPRLWPVQVRCDTDTCEAVIAFDPAPLTDAALVAATRGAGWASSPGGKLARCPKCVASMTLDEKGNHVLRSST